MKENTKSKESRPPGRPRSEVSKKAILQTAYQLLKKHGIQSVSSHEIAEKAGVSTATIYRWWPSKEAVMLDAFFNKVQSILPINPVGSFIEQLRDHVIRSAAFLASTDGKIMAKIILTIYDSPTLKKEFLERFYLLRRSIGIDIANKAKTAGELPLNTNVEILIDVLYGPLFYRLFLGHEVVNESFARSIASIVLDHSL
ncbi:MAG TPA: TetR/AcrR family transcriptional regulator [Desulfomonilia bacterium]|nr:TetR/AcrR family transcriptional regulator [Desulfomonilia bacterium]